MDEDVEAALMRAGHQIAALQAENLRLLAENRDMRLLLARYRDETPIGHQPHMVAWQTDVVLGRS